MMSTSKVLPVLMWGLLLSTVFGEEVWTDIDYDAGLKAMQMAIDSQLTREAKYGRGMLSGKISNDGPTKLQGEARVVWDSENLYVDAIRLEQIVTSQTGEKRLDIRPHEKLIVGKSESWLYVPSLNECWGNGLGTKRYASQDIDIRPLRTWSAYSPGGNTPLSKILYGFRDPGRMTANFSKTESGLMRLRALTSEFIVSLSTGDLIKYSTYPREDSKPEPEGIAYHDTEWVWARDRHGVPYCKQWKKTEYRDGTRSDILLTRTIDISEYDSDPPKAARTFKLEQLGLAPGTKCTLHGATGMKHWVHGVQQNPKEVATQADLDRLIQETRRQGFFSTGKKE